MWKIERIQALQKQATAISEEILRSAALPEDLRKRRVADCCKRLAPIYENLHRLTRLPDIEDLTDSALLKMYQTTTGEPGDDFVDALAAEIERRELDV